MSNVRDKLANGVMLFQRHPCSRYTFIWHYLFSKATKNIHMDKQYGKKNGGNKMIGKQIVILLLNVYSIDYTATHNAIQHFPFYFPHGFLNKS